MGWQERNNQGSCCQTPFLLLQFILDALWRSSLYQRRNDVWHCVFHILMTWRVIKWIEISFLLWRSTKEILCHRRQWKSAILSSSISIKMKKAIEDLKSWKIMNWIGDYHDPVTFKVFTEFTTIVAIATTGKRIFYLIEARKFIRKCVW